MSFILDALKKSENERARQSGPALLEARVVPRQRGVPAWAIVLGVVLVANVALLAWVLLRPARVEPVGVPAPVAVAPAPVAPAPAVVPPPPVVQAPPAQPPAVALPPTAQVLPPLPAASPVEEPRVAPVNPADFQPARPPERQTSALADAATIAADGGLPTAADLATLGVPELRLALHVYDANPSSRYVLMNSQRLRENETSSEGVRVERIDPNAVILSFRGTRFRLAPGL
ncbi:MAG: general secretion pathway protein GspB [Steroidobacteraceae bacterium]